MGKFLGIQVHRGVRYEYFADSAMNPLHVNQFKLGPSGLLEEVGWMCSFPAWERSLHKICNA